MTTRLSSTLVESKGKGLKTWKTQTLTKINLQFMDKSTHFNKLVSMSAVWGKLGIFLSAN